MTNTAFKFLNIVFEKRGVQARKETIITEIIVTCNNFKSEIMQLRLVLLEQ